MRAGQTQPVKTERATSSGKTSNAELQATLFAMSQKDDLGVLGLDRTADDDDVRRAYLALAQRYHPHRFVRYQNAETSRIANEIFVRVQGAYGRLSGSHKIPTAGRATPRTVRSRADLATSEAAGLLQYHQYDVAIDQLSAVLKAEPSHREALIWLNVARARKHKAAGEVEPAIAAYRRVLEQQADHAEATAEVQRLALPQQASLLKRIFKLGG